MESKLQLWGAVFKREKGGKSSELFGIQVNVNYLIYIPNTEKNNNCIIAISYTLILDMHYISGFSKPNMLLTWTIQASLINTNSWIMWIQDYINCGFVVKWKVWQKTLGKLIYPSQCPSLVLPGWTGLNAVHHPAGTDMRTGLSVWESEESGTGGRHGDAGWWRERVAHSGWHGTSCRVQNGSLSLCLSAWFCLLSYIDQGAWDLHWLDECFRLSQRR